MQEAREEELCIKPKSKSSQSPRSSYGPELHTVWQIGLKNRDSGTEGRNDAWGTQGQF